MKHSIPLCAALLFIFLVFAFWMSNVYFAPPDFSAYYAYAHSVLFDGDLDFSNEYTHFGYEKHMFYITGVGYLSNDWPIGTGLLWMPFLAAGGAAAHLSGSPTDGFSQPYTVAVMLGILFYVGCGLFAAFSFLEKCYSAQVAFWSVLLIFFGTPLLFYTFYGGLMSHATGFFAVTCFLALWASTIKERSPAHWALLGLLGGIITIVRPQHIVCLIVIPVEFVLKRRNAKFWQNAASVRAFLRGCALAIPTFIVAMLPQILFWGKVYGSPFHFPKLEEMHWLHPAIFEMLFSDYHGFILWTPIVLLCIPGFYFVWKKHRVIAAGLLACLLVQVYVNSANEVWWAGGSFSNRRFTDYGFIFMVGLAGLLGKKSGRLWLMPAILLAGWTFLLVIAERAQTLTLEHYVPWNGAFFSGVATVLIKPWKWSTALLGNFGELHFILRILATIFLGILLTGVWYLFERREVFKKGPRIILWTALGIFILLDALVFVAVIRTCPVPQKAAQRLYHTNRFLWNNYYEYGYYCLRKGRMLEALAAYKKARTLIPERPQPARYIGSVYESLGDYEKAEHFYREALKIDPHYRRVQLLLDELEEKVKGKK